MMENIIITAHPSSNGFTHKIAQKIYQENKNSKIINLFEIKEQLKFLEFENLKEDFPINDKIKEIQNEILNCEKIYFIFPIWNLSEPAILKNFFDLVFTAGFAFKYTKDTKLKPLPLLKGKTAVIYTTCDAPKWIYTIIGNPAKRIWKLRLNLCGINLKKFKIIDKMRLKTLQEKEEILLSIK